MSPDDFDDLLASHALDALDDAERQLVEERLADDPAIRAQYAALEQTVVAAAHELGPPDHVWDRLAGAVFPGEPRVPHPRLLVHRGAGPEYGRDLADRGGVLGHAQLARRGPGQDLE